MRPMTNEQILMRKIKLKEQLVEITKAEIEDLKNELECRLWRRVNCESQRPQGIAI